ncbi:MAG: N-acetylneuraminate synthase [bacterium]|nr:N-acetylneuraminate synthase [bacterium]
MKNKTEQTITIGGKKVGTGQPVFIIAEAGVNHNGDKALAKKLIDAAVTAGADAVKFQTFDPETLVTKEAKKADYQDRNEHIKGGGESQYEMLKRLQLPREVHVELKAYAEQKGIIFLSTPFSLSDAKFLKELGVVAFKVGSSDTNNLPFLKTIATWGLPIILSTGMSDMEQVRDAVRVIQNPSSDKNRSAPFTKGRIGRAPLIVLHCTTSYPAPLAEVNLRAMRTLSKELEVLVGFSDHTEGTLAPVLSVALGACVIEKHLTLDKEMAGPDQRASLNPQEFAEMVRAVRDAERALGTGEKGLFDSEREIAKVARKSLVTARAVKKGEIFTAENLTTKRPGTGLSPALYDRVIGTKALRNIPADTLITKNDYAS